MKFQEKLQLLRKQKGLSQEALANRTGVTRQSVAKWEAGQSYPDLDNLIQLSSLLGVSLDYLVKEQEDDNCLYRCEERPRSADEAVVGFLLRAKKACYAGKGAETDPSRPNSHDLQYSEGSLQYIDTYLGGEKFAGEEALWRGGVPSWAMNYAGRIVAEGFSGDFLREALLAVPQDMPYRGPRIHRSGDYSYHCMVNGEFEWFSGYEEIFCGERKVYECVFHGGTVKK